MLGEESNMAISEKIELLGKGLYKDIPDQLTLTSIPTVSELDWVGSEDYDKAMLEKILPKAVEEKIDFRQLLEIDYYWVCRCLRFLNYGPYYTTNTIYCDKCGAVHGEYRVNLTSIDCKPLPEGFINKIVIPKDSFIDFEGDVVLRLLTIQEVLNSAQDKQFRRSDGEIDRAFARICYMIKSIKGQDNLTPIEVRIILEKEFSSADYKLLRETVSELTNYGLRAGGSTQCPKCGGRNASFIALMDDRFLRPTVGDLRQWKHDRSTGSDKDLR